MTSRERVEAALKHVEPDRTPVFEYVLLAPIAETLLGRRYALNQDYWPAMVAERGYEASVRQIAVDTLDLACLLGHDMIRVSPNPLPPGVAEAVVEVEDSLSDDPVAAIAGRNDEYSRMQWSLADEKMLIYHFLQEEMSRRGVDLPIMASAYAHGVWTDVNLMVAMALEPEVVHRHFSLATQRALAMIEKYISAGLDQVGVGGDFAGNRLLISPQSYREFIVPHVRVLSRRIHEAGMWAINTSDGNLWPVIDDFLLGCEVDGYLEIDLHAGMELGKLKAAYGDKVTFYGNLDCGNTLSFASPGEVRQHVIDCIEAGLGNGGHILCAGNAITASVPIENYLAAVNAYRDMFSLSRLSL